MLNSSPMPEMRRVSARVRTETPAKKRQHLEFEARVTSKREKRETAKSDKPEDAPTHKVKPHRILPTIEDHSYSDAALKSIAESGVLAASLKQTRQRWLVEGLFQRYWIKPGKKKDQVEISKNPSKDSMQKIGTCMLHVEPLVFEATVYLVRDPSTVHPPAKASQKSFLQYAHSGSGRFGYSGAIGPSLGNVKYQPPPPPLPAAAVATPQAPQAPQLPTAFNDPARSTLSLSGSSAQGTLTPATVPSGHAPTGSYAKPSQDPVIQMLATRASTNPELKALMKVVASGDANGDELKVFQSHIDDLNLILQRQNRNQIASPFHAATSPQMKDESKPANLQIPPSRAIESPAKPPKPTKSKSDPALFSPSVRQDEGMANQTPPPVSQTPTSTPNPHSNCIVLEFVGGSSDRFLFPKYSIMEAATGSREVIASFLLVRKGKEGDSSGFDPKLDYHQPVTIRVTTDFPKVFGCLFGAVAPLAEVQKYMADVISNTVRADDVHLAMQIAKDTASFDAGPNDGAVKEPRPDGKWGRKKVQDDIDRRCRFCYTLVPTADALGADGPVCRECGSLRIEKSKAWSSNRSIYEKQCSAAQSLTLSSAVH